MHLQSAIHGVIAEVWSFIKLQTLENIMYKLQNTNGGCTGNLLQLVYIYSILILWELL